MKIKIITLHCFASGVYIYYSYNNMYIDGEYSWTYIAYIYIRVVYMILYGHHTLHKRYTHTRM